MALRDAGVGFVGPFRSGRVPGAVVPAREDGVDESADEFRSAASGAVFKVHSLSRCLCTTAYLSAMSPTAGSAMKRRSRVLSSLG